MSHGIQAQLGLSTLVAYQDGAILRVSFDNPPINVLNKQVIIDLRSLLGHLKNDPETKVVIFGSSNPEFFISHADLSHFKDGLTAPPPRLRRLTTLHEIFEGYRKLDKVTIAIIEGRANGVGTEFVLSLDMRFADINKASFGLFEVALGCLPGGSGTQRLPPAVGRGRALELILGCDAIDAGQAQLYGLVNRSMDTTLLRAFVDRLAQRIASFPLQAISLAKQAVDFGLGDPREGLIQENFLAGQLMASAETKRRIRKFLSLIEQEPEFEKDLSEYLPRLANDE